MRRENCWRIGVAGLGTVGGGLSEVPCRTPGLRSRGRRAAVTRESAPVRARVSDDFDISSMTWFDDPVALASSPENRCVRGADRRSRRPGQGGCRGGAAAWQARCHRQQGADRPARRGSWPPWPGAKGVPAAVRGGGDGRHAGGQDAARGDGRRRGGARRRHPQRHLQLYSDRDGGLRSRLRRVFWPRPSGWATRKPIPPPTSAASTPATRSRSWRPWPSAARPRFADAEIEGLDQRRAAGHPAWRKDLGYRIKLVATAAGVPEGVSVQGASRPGAAGPSSGADRTAP